MKVLTYVAVPVILLLGASSAHAGTVGFGVFENDDRVNVDGLDLTVEITEDSGTLFFKFANESTIDATITRIYFESGLSTYLDLANGLISDESDGVDFDIGKLKNGKYNDPPGGANIDWASTDFGVWLAQPPDVADGLDSPDLTNYDEYLELTFGLNPGYALDDVMGSLVRPDSDGRIAVHVQRLDPDNQYSISAVAVPLPPAVWAGLALLGGLGVLRTRRRVRS